MATFEGGTRQWHHPAAWHPTFSNIRYLDHIPVEEGEAFRAQSAPYLRTPVCPACGSRLVPASAISDSHYFQTDFKQPQSGNALSLNGKTRRFALHRSHLVRDECSLSFNW